MIPVRLDRCAVGIGKTPLPERRGGEAPLECVMLRQSGEIGVELIAAVAIVAI
jgi:hypothetical protein